MTRLNMNIDASFLELIDTKVSDQSVPVELDETRKNYLHPLAGTRCPPTSSGR
jgi:hypothetical protein